MNKEEPASDPVTLVELIGRLVEPPEPVLVSMLPQTAGWAVLAVLAAAALGWLAWRWYGRWRANAYRRAALAALEACQNDPSMIAEILRRTALTAWPREKVASLSGRDWLEFLDETGGRGTFNSDVGDVLLTAPYRSRAQGSPDIAKSVAQWIRRHRVSREALR